MARSKKKKQTVSQKVVGVATTGMPRPVRSVLGNRVVSSLIVLALPALALTGIVTVDWQGGRPKLSIDEERAAELKQDLSEVKERVAERVQAFREAETVDGPPLADAVPALRREADPAQTEQPEWLKFDEASDRIAERITEISDRLKQARDATGSDSGDESSPRKIRPLFQFK